MGIGEKLRQARLMAKLTQESVAEMAGVSRQTISNWENGRSLPDIASIIILSDAYDLTLDSLLKGDNEIMKHLKESTNVTKSNRHLAISLILAGIFGVAIILMRVFLPFLPITDLIPNVIAMLVVAVGVIIAVVGAVDIKKLSEQKTSNKALIKIGLVALYVLLYIPMVLLIPEAISSGFQVEANWLQAVIRASVAGVLLVPALVMYKKFKYVFTESGN